jgi:hypothetical protein
MTQINGFMVCQDRRREIAAMPALNLAAAVLAGKAAVADAKTAWGAARAAGHVALAEMQTYQTALNALSPYLYEWEQRQNAAGAAGWNVDPLGGILASNGGGAGNGEPSVPRSCR